MGSNEYILIFHCCNEACCTSLLFGCGGYGGKGGYGYGGKGGYGYGGSRYKRSTDSYTAAEHSPVTHYSPAVPTVHSSSYADASPVHQAVYKAVPASRTIHVSGHSSPAVVYSYPMHDGDSYGNTHSSYGFTSTPSYGYTTPSYGHSYGHNTPIHSTVVHQHESPYGSATSGQNTPSYGYATPSPAVIYNYPMHDGDSYGNTHSSYGYTSTPSYGYTTPSFGHSTLSHSTVVHKHESPYGSATYGQNT